MEIRVNEPEQALARSKRRPPEGLLASCYASSAVRASAGGSRAVPYCGLLSPAMTEGNMKTPAFFFITALVDLSMSACVLTGARPRQLETVNLVTLENSALSMTIRKSPGTAYLSARPQGHRDCAHFRAVRALALCRHAGETGRAGLRGQRACAETSLDVIPTAAGSEVVLTYSDFPNLDLSARVRGTFSNSEPLTHWTIEVQNRSGRKIERVRFPLLRALPGIRRR